MLVMLVTTLSPVKVFGCTDGCIVEVDPALMVRKTGRRTAGTFNKIMCQVFGLLDFSGRGYSPE